MGVAVGGDSTLWPLASNVTTVCDMGGRAVFRIRGLLSNHIVI